MLKTILLIALATLALLMMVAATRPDNFRVERSADILAPPERIVPLINDLHKFNTWNPYALKDPATQGQYSGSPSGPGARYAWVSEKVGTGSMTIQDSAPTRVTMRLDFEQPFAASNMAEFQLRLSGDKTRITWSMHGPANFMSKLMETLTLMDRMVGKDFESGLANLKMIAETR